MGKNKAVYSPHFFINSNSKENPLLRAACRHGAAATPRGCSIPWAVHGQAASGGPCRPRTTGVSLAASTGEDKNVQLVFLCGNPLRWQKLPVCPGGSGDRSRSPTMQGTDAG